MDLDEYARAVSKHSGRAAFENLSRVAAAFRDDFAKLDASQREAAAATAGTAGKKYVAGWLGLWDRMIDTGGLDGDATLKSTCAKRAVQYHPVVVRLRELDRPDAIPAAAPRGCRELSDALNAINGRTGSLEPERRDLAVDAVASVFIDRRACESVGDAFDMSDAMRVAWESRGLEPLRAKAERPERASAVTTGAITKRIRAAVADASRRRVLDDSTVMERVAASVEEWVEGVASRLESRPTVGEHREADEQRHDARNADERDEGRAVDSRM